MASNADATSCGQAGAEASLWDVEADRGVAVLSGSSAALPDSFAFSPDGKTLAVGREFGIVELWDVSTRLPTRTRRDHSDTYQVLGLDFSGDGSTLVSMARYEGGGFSVDRLRMELARHHRSMGYEPRNEILVTDVESGRIRGRLNSQEGRPVLSHGGDSLATFGHDGHRWLRDVPR